VPELLGEFVQVLEVSREIDEARNLPIQVRQFGTG
jgi:hypothetical protein